MDRKLISTAGFFGMTAIILGAFGAHALKKVLTPDQLATFETGVKYQMYHALFLLFVAVNQQLPAKTKKVIALLTACGIILFSGSIYLLSTIGISSIDFRSIGFVTPIGGVLLVIAWGILAFSFINKKDKS